MDTNDMDMNFTLRPHQNDVTASELSVNV